MRDRIAELLPLLLVVITLIIFQVSRSDVGLSFLSLATPSPTPVPLSASAPTPISAALPLQVAGARSQATRPAPGPVATCNSNQPRFIGGMALLRVALGSAMGDPLSCEAVIDSEGNTQQTTTTGLAYHRKLLGVDAFTNGWDHWAVGPEQGLIHWSGDLIDPPL